METATAALEVIFRAEAVTRIFRMGEVYRMGEVEVHALLSGGLSLLGFNRVL